LFRGSAAAVAQQAARYGTGLVTVLEDRLAVDHHGLITLGPLHTAPFAAREVVDNFHRQDVQLVEVVNHDIGRCSFYQRTTSQRSG